MLLNKMSQRPYFQHRYINTNCTLFKCLPKIPFSPDLVRCPQGVLRQPGQPAEAPHSDAYVVRGRFDDQLLRGQFDALHLLPGQHHGHPAGGDVQASRQDHGHNSHGR